MLEQELAEFGRRMGLPTLAFNAQGLAALDVEGMGRLYLERQTVNGAEELLLYLARPCPAHDREAPARALALCHYRHVRALPLCAGLHKEQLIVLTRLSERESVAPQMEKAVIMLAETMRTVVQEA